MEAEGIPIQPSSYSSKQVTVRIIIIPFTYPIHPFQKAKGRRISITDQLKKPLS